LSILVPLAGVLLAIGCIAYVAFPMYVARRAHHSAWSRSRLRLELTERKEALYAAIVELEFDRDVGKLPEEDYQRQRQVLEGQALGVLAELEGLDTGGEEAALRARIERDVAGRQSRTDGDSTSARCPSCQTAVTDRFRFCPECGAALSDATA
jgi:hypothetical protein